MSTDVGGVHPGGQVPDGDKFDVLRTEFAAIRLQLEITEIRLNQAQRRLQRLHNRIDNGSHNELRRQVGLDLGDQTQKPVEEDSVPNFRVRSAQSEALERLCANGLLRKADVSEVHPDLLTLHGLLTRYVAGAVLTPFRWLQRSGWLRQAPGRRGLSGATTGGTR